MTIDTSRFRQVVGNFATGVTIVTAVGPDGGPLGFTANSFSSVSLKPPLVLFSLDRRANSLKGFESSRHFAVNILREDQDHLSRRFANSFPRTSEKFLGVDYAIGVTDCPLLSGAIACFECETRFRYDGGDHVIFVGEVISMTTQPVADRPLLYFRGQYRRLDEDA